MPREAEPQRRRHEDQSGAHDGNQRKESHRYAPEERGWQFNDGEAQSAKNPLNSRDDQAGHDACGNEVARLLHHGVAVLGVKGQNAATPRII